MAGFAPMPVSDCTGLTTRTWTVSTSAATRLSFVTPETRASTLSVTTLVYSFSCARYGSTAELMASRFTAFSAEVRRSVTASPALSAMLETKPLAFSTRSLA